MTINHGEAAKRFVELVVNAGDEVAAGELMGSDAQFARVREEFASMFGPRSRWDLVKVWHDEDSAVCRVKIHGSDVAGLPDLTIPEASVRVSAFLELHFDAGGRVAGLKLVFDGLKYMAQLGVRVADASGTESKAWTAISEKERAKLASSAVAGTPTT